MPQARRSYDSHFKEGSVRVVRETGKPIEKVAQDLGIPKATLTNWVREDPRRRGERADPATVYMDKVRQMEKEIAEASRLGVQQRGRARGSSRRDLVGRDPQCRQILEHGSRQGTGQDV